MVILVDLRLKKLLLLYMRDSFSVLKFSLSVPILVKQVTVGPKFLSDFSNQVQVLLCFITGDAVLRIVNVLYFNPEKSLSFHEGHDET